MDIFSFITNELLRFKCENFQIWKDGRCTGGGLYDGTVTVCANGISEAFKIEFDKSKAVEIECYEEYCKVSAQDNRVVLRSASGMECTILAHHDTISCLRFSLEEYGCYVEYYGKPSISGLRSAPISEAKFPSKKNEYRDEMYEDIRLMLRDNTYNPATIDLQAEVVAFASKKYMEFYDSYASEDRERILEPIRNHIFRDTWSLLYSEILPGASGVFLDGVVSDAKEWYDHLTRTPRLNVRGYISSFYSALRSSDDVDYSHCIARYAITP